MKFKGLFISLMIMAVVSLLGHELFVAAASGGCCFPFDPVSLVLPQLPDGFALVPILLGGLFSGTTMSGIATASMGIPLGGLISERYPRLGRIAEHHPMERIRTRVAEGAIKFGKALAKGATAVAVRVIRAGDAFSGIAIESTQASDIDNDQYLDSDPVGECTVGVPTVWVEEAVDEASPVRVRLTSEDKTPGYQEIEFSAPIVGTDATGLANDTTAYHETIELGDSSPDQDIDLVGSAAQTINALIAEVNADLEGVGLAIIDGKLRLTSMFLGDESTVKIKAGGTLFAALTNFAALADPVQGISDPDTDIEVGNFCTTAEAGRTARLTNAEFAGSTDGPGRVPLELKPGTHDLIPD